MTIITLISKMSASQTQFIHKKKEKMTPMDSLTEIEFLKLDTFRGIRSSCQYGTFFYSCPKEFISIYTFKTWILSVCSCSRFPKPPEVPASWNFGSRRHLSQVGSWQSLIFKFLIFTDSGVIFCGFFFIY